MLSLPLLFTWVVGSLATDDNASVVESNFQLYLIAAAVVVVLLYFFFSGTQTKKPVHVQQERKVPQFSTQYTIEEIAKHNNEKDLWIIVGTKVYDLSDFVHEHPGEVGPLVARSGAGQDATPGFYGGQHPDSVEDQIRQYHIGFIKEHSKEEVAKHNTPDDCWIVINDKIYDITKWIKEHPGGASILKNAGGDATEGYKKINAHKAKGSENYSPADLKMATLLIGAVRQKSN